MRDGFRSGRPGEPIAHHTILCWVLMGALDSNHHTPLDQVKIFHTITEHDVTKDLQRFWELEELPKTRINTSDEQHCEALFQDTHTRDDTGRYMVRLPVKPGTLTGLGESRLSALRLFLNNEQRLGRNLNLQQTYFEFMKTYHELGYMQTVSETNPDADLLSIASRSSQGK